jgi:hypothetical protein
MKQYTNDGLIDIVCGDDEEFEVVESTGHYYNGISNYHVIVKEISTGKFYRIFYTTDSIGIEQPVEVKPVVKTTIEYVGV